MTASYEHCWLDIPQETRQLGHRLLHQQFWLWGTDIRHPDNGLLKYGFVRYRPDPGKKGSSLYEHTLSPESSIRLWGFGVFYGDACHSHGMYLQRYHFTPRFGKMSGIVWRLAEWPNLWVPHTTADCQQAQNWLVEVLNWIARYEQWALEVLGLNHRRQGLKSWHSPVVSAEEIVCTWLKLANECANLKINQRKIDNGKKKGASRSD